MADNYYTTIPLRRVVEIIEQDGRPREVYECGHSWWAPMNPYSGIKKAARRRCAFCAPLDALHVETERQARNDIRDGRRYV